MSRAKPAHMAKVVAMNTTIRTLKTWEGPLAAYDAEMRAAGRVQSTRKVRHYHLRRFASDHPTLTPGDIARDHLVEWLGSRDWAPETRRGYRASLSEFFRWMHQSGNRADNPAATLSTVRIPRTLPRPAPDEALLEALRTKDERVRLAIEVMDAAGLRRAEVAGLHSEHVITDLSGTALRITGKGGHTRIVPIPDRLGYRLRKCQTGFIFPGDDCGHISPPYLGKLVSQALPGKWTGHTLRHRYATRVYAATSDIRAVQELLGHASIQTTARYIGVTGDRLRVAAATAWSLPIAA